MFNKNKKSTEQKKQEGDTRAKIVLYSLALMVVLILLFCGISYITGNRNNVSESEDGEYSETEDIFSVDEQTEYDIYLPEILKDEMDPYEYVPQYNMPITRDIPGANASIDVVDVKDTYYGTRYFETKIGDYLDAVFLYDIFEQELTSELINTYNLQGTLSTIKAEVGYLNGQKWHEVVFCCHNDKYDSNYYIVTFNNMKIYICVGFTDPTYGDYAIQLVEKEILTYKEYSEGGSASNSDSLTDGIPSTVEEYVTSGYLQSEQDGIILKDTYYDSLDFGALFDGSSALYPYLRVDYYPGDAEITSITLKNISSNGTVTIEPSYDYILGNDGVPGIIFIDVTKIDKDGLYQIFFTSETEMVEATYVASTEEMKEKLEEQGYTFVYENHMFDAYSDDEPIPDYLLEGRTDSEDSEESGDED